MRNCFVCFILIIICSNFLYSSDFFDKNMTIKPYHQAVNLKCSDCHLEKDKKDYKFVKTEVCLTCHVSKKYLADRLAFLEHKNPHNSIHDGMGLNCRTCHSSHKPSYNMCADCHKAKNWMREIK